MNRSTFALTAILLAGCGGAEKAAPPAAAAVAHDFIVTASNYAFQAPDSTPAGLTRVVMTNNGPSLHHVQFVKLDSGKTMQDLGEAMQKPGPPPAWAMFVAGPNAVAPTKSSEGTVNLAAGNYAIICLVDLPEHKPHFALGMMHALTVTPSTAAVAAAPAADVTLELADYKFSPSKPLTAGKHVLNIVNKGPQMHEVLFVRFAPGKTLDDLGKWMNGDMKSPPPGEPLGGTSAAAPGGSTLVPLDLTPGNYAMICFIPDAKDGKPHLEHGMVQPFKVD